MGLTYYPPAFTLQSSPYMLLGPKIQRQNHHLETGSQKLISWMTVLDEQSLEEEHVQQMVKSYQQLWVSYFKVYFSYFFLDSIPDKVMR